MDAVEKNTLPLLGTAKPAELSLPQVLEVQQRVSAQRNKADSYKGEADANKVYGSDISQDAQVCLVSDKNKSLPSRLLNPPPPCTGFYFFLVLKQ
jgi:hypothetical protein